MGTGIGEAALLQAMGVGAATGAVSSAITGGDPLKGALLGAVGGGATSALGGALGGQAAGSALEGVAAGGSGLTTPATTALNAGETIASSGLKMPVATSAPPTLEGTIGGGGIKVPPSAATSTVGGSPYSVSGGQSNLYSLGSSTTATSPMAGPQTVVPKTGFLDVFKPSPIGQDFGQRVGNYIVQNPTSSAMTGSSIANMLGQTPKKLPGEEEYTGPLSQFSYNPTRYRPAFADGGITDLSFTEDYASGGIADLGAYSDGGRLLKGPGDGMSDSIPAKIGRKQPARLADGEFVVPADVVSHLGNGSTDAGAKQLYAMMDKVRRERTGSKKQGKQINPRKYVPA